MNYAQNLSYCHVYCDDCITNKSFCCSYCIRDKQYLIKHEKCAVCFSPHQNGCKLCGLENPIIAHMYKHPHNTGILEIIICDDCCKTYLNKYYAYIDDSDSD